MSDETNATPTLRPETIAGMISYLRTQRDALDRICKHATREDRAAYTYMIADDARAALACLLREIDAQVGDTKTEA